MSEMDRPIRPAAKRRDDSPENNTASESAAAPIAVNCRLLLDEPADGAWNMAVDETLLEQAAAGAGPFLRLYAWREPTLSIGYFQHYAAALEWMHSARLTDMPVVRRPSGGGAILHDREITYALVLPRAAPPVPGPALYRLVHERMCVALRRHAISPYLRAGAPGPPEQTQRSDSPFFCFLRRFEGDLLLEGRKAGGSAQRRRHGALLQHGSLILAPSDHLPALRGLDLDETAEPFAAALRSSIAAEIAAGLGMKLQSGRLDPPQRARARRLVHAKHGSDHWLQRR